MSPNKRKLTSKKTKLPKFLNSQRIKLIYNPNAGQKRKLLPGRDAVALEDIEETLKQYQIIVDFFPTKSAGHATELAREAASEGYDTVLVAGGDGTVGEVVNGLVGSQVTLGIIPLGSVMNIARMLSIPMDLEKAVQIIKINRSRSIDLGAITKLNGERVQKPTYFMESVGFGLEAQIQQHILSIEKGDLKGILKIIHSLFEYYGHRAEIIIDGESVKTRATLVTISNGPIAAAALPLAPKAKLNDHRLTVSLYDMTKFELIRHFWKILRGGKGLSRKIQTYQGKKIKVLTHTPRLIHADARVFGETPVELRVLPNALKVICGFPKDNQNALVKRTFLDP